jgi:hypothetical protein
VIRFLLLIFFALAAWRFAQAPCDLVACDDERYAQRWISTWLECSTTWPTWRTTNVTAVIAIATATIATYLNAALVGMLNAERCEIGGPSPRTAGIRGVELPVPPEGGRIDVPPPPSPLLPLLLLPLRAVRSIDLPSETPNRPEMIEPRSVQAAGSVTWKSAKETIAAMIATSTKAPDQLCDAPTPSIAIDWYPTRRCSNRRKKERVFARFNLSKRLVQPRGRRGVQSSSNSRFTRLPILVAASVRERRL